jgi:hypothetical protein
VWFSPGGGNDDKDVKSEFGKAWAWSTGAKAWVKPQRDCVLSGASEMGANVH